MELLWWQQRGRMCGTEARAKGHLRVRPWSTLSPISDLKFYPAPWGLAVHGAEDMQEPKEEVTQLPRCPRLK